MLKAPFPWFGGKSRVSDIVWDHFGDVPNYVEPFFGSGAVLLGRQTAPGIETINDRDCFVANFWRALQHDSSTVAAYADNPVNEADQHARHLWLVNNLDFQERMKTDPLYYDAMVAGWWVWGQCIWIGSGWCCNAGKGVHRQLPHLGDAGKGVHRKLPHLGDEGTDSFIGSYLTELAKRLRRVRVCCGDWARVCGPSPTVKLGVTGVFLDPPYADEAHRTDDLYSVDSGDVAHDVREWAAEWGSDSRMRIALCGYEGEHRMPDSWECIAWKARGGYGSQGDNQARENSRKERIWFSPYCVRQERLF